MEKTIEIPFGAKDSELKGWEYTIPEGMEAEIKDGKIIVKQKESEEERIREAIESIIRVYGKTQGEWIAGYDMDTLVVHLRDAFAYLERQKEQKPVENPMDIHNRGYVKGVEDAYNNVNEAKVILKRLAKENPKPAEWSEEFLRLMGITVSQDGNQVCVLLGENLAEGIAGFGDTLADAVEEFKKEWRQFDRFRKAAWKPSEEQMCALKSARYMMSLSGDYYDTTVIIGSLITDLQKLL